MDITLKAVLVLALMIIIPELAQAATTDIIITEIGAYQASGHEWVEIFNRGSVVADITGWVFWEDETNHRLTLKRGADMTLAPGEYAVITQDDVNFLADYPSVTAKIFDSSWGSLNESGEEIGLKDSAGVFGERFTYIAAARFSLERKDANFVDYSAANWIQHPSGNTVGRENYWHPAPASGSGATGETPTNGATNDISVPILPWRNVSGEVLINELVADPADGEVEFVELYNRFGETITLDGWWLEEGSETKTPLQGILSPAGFFVIQAPRGNLNNPGDIVILHDPQGTVIDRLAYGNWDDGNRADNAERPDDPLSLARRADGQDADNDWYDFALTKIITRGSQNIIANAESQSNSQTLRTPNSPRPELGTKAELRTVIINELYPNPPGSDSAEEFIELKNTGGAAVDLTGWLLGDDSRQRYTLKEGRIEAGGFLALKRSLTGLALNNTGGDEVKLYPPEGGVVAGAAYEERALEGQSYARDAAGMWSWTTKVTRNIENVIEGANQPPVPVIEVDQEAATGETVIFDASDTADPEGDALTFAWDWGDGTSSTERRGEAATARHQYQNTGVYTVTLRVEDSRDNLAEKRVVITVKAQSAFVGGQLSAPGMNKIGISEFIPDPAGSDEAEFIELFNPTEEEVDLSDFKLDDEEGGSRGYLIPAGTRIGPGAYLVLGKQKTKIVLNNTADAARLITPAGEVIQEVAYDSVPEGASYVRDEDEKWVWTTTITPGEMNIIQNVRTTKSTNIRTTNTSKNSMRKPKPALETAIEKIRELDIGDQVRVTGVVAVAPGVLGAQYFYLVGASTSSPAGVQVYQNNKDFPALTIDEIVTVTGEIAEAYGETRVKVRSHGDIQPAGEKRKAAPVALAAAEIGDSVVGALVEVAGEIIEKKSSYFYLDDGSEEARVYLKAGAGIERDQIKVGDVVRVVGLVSERNGQYQILPRSSDDIGVVGGEEGQELALAGKTDGAERDLAETYLTATAGGLTAILIGLMARARAGLLIGLLRKVGIVALAIVRRKV